MSNAMKRQQSGPQPIRMVDGTMDITERDIARQRFYQLLSEQAVWNATRPKPKRGLFKLFA